MNNRIKSNIIWASVFAIFCAVCLTVWFMRGRESGGNVAVIRHDNTVIRTIDLQSVTEPYEFIVKDRNGGTNTIRVENGRIAVIDADCTDKICVHQGYISDGAVPIVCLPHRLTVAITGADNDIDAVAGRN